MSIKLILNKIQIIIVIINKTHRLKLYNNTTKIKVKQNWFLTYDF